MQYLSFKNLSIFKKLLTLVLLTIIPLFLIFALVVIPTVSNKYIEDKQHSLQNVVESAHSIVNYYNSRVETGELLLSDAKNLAVQEVNSMRYDGKNYFFMYDLNGVMMASGSKPEKIGDHRLNVKDFNGKQYIKEMVEVSRKDGGGFVRYHFPKMGEKTPSPKLSYVKLFKPWDCFIATGVYIDDVEANISEFKEELYISFIIASLVSIIIGFIVAQTISKPLKEVQESAEKAASGDLNIDISYKASDEIGKLSNSFISMVGNIRSQMVEIENKSVLAQKAMEESKFAKKEIEKQQIDLTENTNLLLNGMEKFSNGDLTVQLSVDNKKDLVKNLFDGFNKAVQSIRRTISHVAESVNSTSSAANQISSSAEEMAAGAQEQSSQTGEVAAAIEEMSITISETTKHVIKTNEVAKDSKTLAQSGQGIIENTIDGMRKIENVVKQASEIIRELGESSEQIGQIIQVINDIADQTNLLALNAAIEAARAGEQGRGFSVVADEVRKLAERTTNATNEIAEMIKKIQLDSKNAVDAIQKGNEEVSNGMAEATKAGDSMHEIVSSSDKVLEISTQVAAASEEQSIAVDEISKSVEGINTITHEAAMGLQQIAGASTDLSQLADNLKDLMNKFKIDARIVNNFNSQEKNKFNENVVG